MGLSVIPAGAGSSYDKDARYFGLSRSKTATQNATALQNAIDGLADEYGGTITVRERYDCDKFLLRRNVGVRSDWGPLFKGGYPANGATPSVNAQPAAPGFDIEDTSGAFITAIEGANAIENLLFFYPTQPYAGTDGGAYVAYPPTIRSQTTGAIGQIAIRGCCFVGARDCIYFDHTAAVTPSPNFAHDMLVEYNYGYPIGGHFFRADGVLDIPRLSRNHVNPGAGAGFLGWRQTDGMIAFTKEVIDWNIANGVAAFYFEATDHFHSFKDFVFGAKTGAHIVNSYGSLEGFGADCVETGVYALPGQAHKAVHVNSLHVIPNAGPIVANRNGVRFGGAGGILELSDILGQLGSNPVVPSSANPNSNSLVRVDGSGTQYLSLDNVRNRVQTGTWTQRIQTVNGSAVVTDKGGT